MRRATHLLSLLTALLLLIACGQSYEETKRINRKQYEQARRQDSAALKVAVMPTLDCLPLYVAQHHHLFDSLYGGVRLKHFNAQMDCDTAMERSRVEGMVTDLVRAMRMERRGTKMRYVAATNAHWQLVSNHNARIRQLKQLDDKMIAMTRFSATDLLTDRVIDSVKLKEERIFKVQINDLNIRMQMLLNNEMDAMWLTEPLATQAHLMHHPAIYDTRKADIQLGVLAFREKEMRHPTRAKQLELFIKAYNQACDSINKHGVQHYSSLIVSECKVKKDVVDSLSRQRYQHAQGPRQKDISIVEKWLDKK